MQTLNMLRRHRTTCAAGRPVDSYSTEPEERRRGWTRCECKIYAHGTLGGVFRKFATKARDWDLAREIVAPYVAAGSWDLATPPPPVSPISPMPGTTPDHPAPGIEIKDAIQTCMRELKKVRSAANTLKKYREVLGQLQRFSDEHGLRFLEEWRPAIVRQFRNGWDVQQSTVETKMSVLKPFFELFVEDEALASNPARIKSRKNRVARAGEETEHQPRNPFTDAEIDRMREACSDYGRPEARRWARTGEARSDTGERSKNRPMNIEAYKNYQRKWTGQDILDFIDLSRHTGLRISDIATFHVSRLKPTGEVKLRATKNGNWVSVWVPEWVQEMIRRRAAIHGPLIFGEHTTSDTNVIADVWRRKLKALWAKAGVWEQKPTHHRFRHTFVRVLLQHNVPVKMVADLVGDTERVIERHYSQWMPERQETVTNYLRVAFGGSPRIHQA